MIFVTVGTHEQQFNRLVEEFDRLKKEGKIVEEVIIQTGYSTYEPKYCKWNKLIPYEEMVENIKNARIVITHGGPSSFIMPLQIGKIPVVVPRQECFNEHVNNHQLEFANAVAERKKNIIVIDDISTLEDTIKNYDSIVSKMTGTMESNNERFNREIEDIAFKLIGEVKPDIKVGILSMQRIKNYGSFLQAYGLKSILEELGANVEFVDYHIEPCLGDNESKLGALRKIYKGIEVLTYSAPLKEKLKYIKYKKNYANNYYPYLGIGKNYNYQPYLDLLVIGSDEVFNCTQNNSNVGFSPELFGVGNNAKKVITYAASFGNTTYEKLKRFNVNETVAEWIDNISNVSVRDENSKIIVTELTGKNPCNNLDPVLAYDFINKCDRIPKTVSEPPYMLLYGYSGRFSRKECKKIRAFADSKGLEIYCIGGVQNCCDKFIDCDPFKVIAYFKNADCVITDTFHGTILSVITHKQFTTVVRETGYGNSEKLNDLLKRLELEDRKIDSLNNLNEIINKKIDYINTDEIICKGRKDTYEYLASNLSR